MRRRLTQVRADKEREATDGHDGTWVAHPGLVPVALEVFDRVMPQPNQIEKQLPDFHATAEDLLQVPEGTITEAGVRQNVAVGLGYVEAWLRGIGCVPLFNLMEDAATAEISRAQLWQWVHHHAVMDDGLPVTVEMVDAVIADELERAKATVDAQRYSAYGKAAELMRELVRAPKFRDFLTVPAYERVLAEGLVVPCSTEVSGCGSLRRIPTLSTMRLSRTWGTRFCSLRVPAELHDEAFCGSACFQEFAERNLNDREAKLLELTAQFVADLVQNDGVAYADGVAGEENGVVLANDDSFFGWVEGFDPVEGEMVEGVGKVHDVAAFEWSEAGVEMVEAGVDEVKRRDGDVPDLAEHAVARCGSAEAVAGPEAASVD